MTATQTACENCGNDELEIFFDEPKHKLKRCPSCNLYQKGFLESETVYEGDYHVHYSKRRKSKMRTAAIRLASTTKYLETERPRTLDVGCSVGATVQAAKDLGWEAMGVDISQNAVKYCQSKGLDCHKIDGVKLPFKDNYFDLLTNWHVIEHCRDVKETLDEWYRVLKPGGVMILETPDSTYLKAQWMRQKYLKFWPPDHLYTFDRSNLSSILENSGFEILPTRILGKATALPAPLAMYAIAYRGYRETCRAIKLCKSLEICCRKPLQEEVRAAA